MKRAVIYGRVSSQDKQDYSRQVFELQDYAERNQYTIVEVFTERISGLKSGDEKKEYSRMLAYIKENEIHTILLTELSRFGRLGYKTRGEIERLATEGVNIFFKDKNLYTLEADKSFKRETMMIIGLLCDMAQSEVETLKKRIVSGLRYSASQNGAISGKYQPYGFTSTDKKLTVDPIEQEVIVEMFNLYKDGMGCSQIAKHLNNKKIPTRYNKVAANDSIKTSNGIVKKGKDFSWSSGTITTMLKNPLYKGERIHNGELFKIQPMISPLLFDTVQSILKQRNNRPIRTIKNDNYLKGIIKCGVCGEAYYMHKRKSNKDSAYVCLSNKKKYDGKTKSCGSPSISIDKLLNSIVITSHFILTKTNSMKELETIQSANAKLKQIEYDTLQNEVTKIKKRLERLIDMREDGDIDKVQYRQRKQKLDDSLNETELKLEALTAELAKATNKERPMTNLNYLPHLRTAISSVKIKSVKSNREFKKIYGVKNDVLTNVVVTYNYYDNFKISYTLSRFSSILTHTDYSTEDIKENPLLNNPFEKHS